MRLKESTLTMVQIAPRADVRGVLGGLAEGFSGNRIPLRAAVLPEGGGLSVQERGACNREKIRLLVPGDAGVKCGDGVQIGDGMWRVAAVQKWSAHIELECEAIV